MPLHVPMDSKSTTHRSLRVRNSILERQVKRLLHSCITSKIRAADA